jgi:hemoglobin-like flavoprotein
MKEMALTEKQKQLISTSFNQVAEIADIAATLFYDRLWEIAPHTKSFFKSTNMKEQGRKLFQTLGVAVGAIHDLDSLKPALQALGKRHIAYGVKAADYDTVGEALLWTLEKGLAESFTPETKEAWATVYSALASIALSAYEASESQA